MKVQVKLTNAVCLGNKGIELLIADENEKHQGTLRISQATVEWRKGKTRPGNGRKIRLSALLEMLDRDNSKDSQRSVPAKTRRAPVSARSLRGSAPSPGPRSEISQKTRGAAA